MAGDRSSPQDPAWNLAARELDSIVDGLGLSEREVGAVLRDS